MKIKLLWLTGFWILVWGISSTAMERGSLAEEKAEDIAPVQSIPLVFEEPSLADQAQKFLEEQRAQWSKISDESFDEAFQKLIRVKDADESYGRGVRPLAAPQEKMPFVIGDIKGGGIRGLGPVKMISCLAKETGCEITHLFDALGGVSIGGIVAGFIATHNVPPDMVSFFKTIAPQIFPVDRLSCLRQWMSLGGTLYPKHNRGALDTILEAHFQARTISETKIPFCTMAVLQEKFGRRTLGSVRHHVFSSILGEQDARQNVLLYNAAQATSAAPSFLGSTGITYNGKEYQCMDGGIVCNTVGINTFLMAQETYKTDIDQHGSIMLSFGTGYTPPKKSSFWRRLNPFGVGGLFERSVDVIDALLSLPTNYAKGSFEDILKAWEVPSYTLDFQMDNLFLDRATDEYLSNLETQAENAFYQEFWPQNGQHLEEIFRKRAEKAGDFFPRRTVLQAQQD